MATSAVEPAEGIMPTAAVVATAGIMGINARMAAGDIIGVHGAPAGGLISDGAGLYGGVRGLRHSVIMYHHPSLSNSRLP